MDIQHKTIFYKQLFIVGYMIGERAKYVCVYVLIGSELCF